MGRLIVLLFCACLMTLASAQCSAYNTCSDCANQTLTQTTCQWCTNDNGTPGYCNLLSNHTTCPTFSAYSTPSDCPVSSFSYADVGIAVGILVVEILGPSFFFCILGIIVVVYVLATTRPAKSGVVVGSQPSSNVVQNSNNQNAYAELESIE